MKNTRRTRAATKETNFVKAQFQPDSPEDENNNSKRYSVLAIIGLIFAVLVPILGLIISIVALKKIDPETEKGRELAIAGIVLAGILFLLSILSAIFDPSLLQTFENSH